MPGRRLFVAVPLPEDAAEAVRSIVDEVRAEPLPDGARDVRWVRLDGLHLTLRFLGPTPEDRIEPTSRRPWNGGDGGPGPIDLELGGAGTFPPSGRPRALWIGIAEGAEALGTAGHARLDAAWPPPAGSPTTARSGRTSRWPVPTASRRRRWSPVAWRNRDGGAADPGPRSIASGCSRASPAAARLDTCP